MEELQKIELNRIVSIVSTLALFVFDELEPVSEEVLEADLEDLYEWLVKVERKATAYKGSKPPVVGE